MYPRRQQFSSCDACRRSRIRCDAHQLKQSSADTIVCSNCSRRNKKCTFEWRNQAYQSRLIAQKARWSCKLANSRASNTALSKVYLQESVNDLMWRFYSRIFEPMLGIWLAQAGNPHINIRSSHLKMSHLMITLDGRQELDFVVNPFNSALDCLDKDDLIDQALLSCVYCFAVRWLPLMLPKSDETLDDYHAALSSSLWKKAQDMLNSVSNKNCYRVVYAMYLFAMTPIPSDCPEDNDYTMKDGIDSCIGQIHMLKKSNKLSDIGFLGLKHIAFWFGVVYNCSMTMSHEKSHMTSGFIEDEPEWRRSHEWTHNISRLVCPTDIMQLSILPDTVARNIIESAGSAKGLTWKAIGTIKYVLNCDCQDVLIERAQGQLLQSLNVFDSSFLPLMEICEKHFLFLSQELQLAWYLVNMHYHLGILVLNEELENQLLCDLVPDMKERATRSLWGLVAALNRALTTPYSLDRQLMERSKFCLISVDPYPYHIINGTRLASRNLVDLFQQQKISAEVFNKNFSLLVSVLDQLPSNSKTLKVLKRNLRSIFNSSIAKEQKASAEQLSSRTQSYHLVEQEQQVGAIYDYLLNLTLPDPHLTQNPIKFMSRIQ